MAEEFHGMGTDFGHGDLTWPSESAYGADPSNNGLKIPVSMNFLADPYTNKQAIRENAGVGKFADITLPLPLNVGVDNSINFGKGQTETTGGLWDMTPGGWWESLKTGFGAVSWAKDMLGFSALYGQRPMDERDTIFQGAQFRQHSYSWSLIPKNSGQGQKIHDIVMAFQALAFPMASGYEQYSRVVHPPVWHISAFDFTEGEGVRWDMEPLPSVLSNVKVTTAQGSLHRVSGGWPAATGLTLQFTELEPAINTGAFIQSRSQLRGGAVRGGDEDG